LVKGPKVGRSAAYRLNLNIAWKGSAKAYKENVSQMKKSAKDLAKERWKVYEKEHLPKEK
jgi:hypothetical protein